MADSSGYAAKAGIILAQTWAADSWTAVDTLLPLRSETLTKAFDELRSGALIGRAAAHDFIHGTQMVAGDLVFDLTYGIGTELVGYGLGAAAAGVYTMANDLSSNVFNLEIDKVANRVRFYEGMVDKVSISGTMGEGTPMQVTLGLIFRRAETVATAFPSITLASAAKERVYMEALRDSTNGLQIADIADALAGGDTVPVSSFEFNLENNLQADGKDSAAEYVIQPIRDDFRTVTLKLGLPRLTATTDNFTDWRDTDTTLQAIATFTESGGDDVVFQFPHLKIADGANFNVGGPGVLEDEVTVEAFYNGPSGSRVNSNIAVDDQASIEWTQV